MLWKIAQKEMLNQRRNVLFNRDLLQAISNQLRSIPRNLKNESSNVLKVWTHHCECVLAYRLRRSQQMIALYTRIWEEQALRQFVRNVRSHLTRRGRDLMLGAVGVSAFNWDANRISEEEMRTHYGELEFIHLLKKKTIACMQCKQSDSMNKELRKFCECDTRADIRTFDNWTVFIEQDDLIVWRRSHPSGSWEYKVYGNYNDVTAEDFLNVQMDTGYRKKWDPTAVQLEVIEKDGREGTNSDVVYWEMQWPRLFANRDYVFKRRYLVDAQAKTAILVSKATQHQRYPSMKNKYRMMDYWSSMVIKPHTEINRPGIEFSLTYFDNPGVNIPAAVTAWVAYRAMPDFLTRLRAATLKYKKYCEDHQCATLYTFEQSDDQRAGGLRKLANEEDTDLQDVDGFFTTLNEELIEEDYEQLKNIVNGQKEGSKVPEQETVSSNHSPENVSNVQSSIAEQQSYWKYLHPTYYIS